ncbi:hypothetical protein SCHPADRAFT_992335 [Schizopora paradoxa]|uniref:BZIP domain-containing protein n=1 Tax=Schizopora paradoxa TaxID=27342 RepID=A0A0H2SEU7_9AGAM|nr:hypothetical protein SCHPADRAFT_992335 [Schizopora paradoxa]
MTRDASQSAVASSSTLWATASKEWVIPAKPKPGRKPKKEPVEMLDTQEVDSKGRRVQNRAAQRAFRERKQSQLAELQARVQSYEQGEIERNVALQNIAKKLKDENEQLRKENQTLKDELERIKSERASDKVLAAGSSSEHQNADARKRWRDEEHESLAVELVSVFSNDLAGRKRQRIGTDSPMLVGTPNPILQQHRHIYTASPPSFASSPESNDAFSPSPYAPLGVGRYAHSRSPSVAHHHGSGVAPPPLCAPTPTPTAPSHLFPSSMGIRVNANVQKAFDVDAFADSAGGPSFDGFDNCGLCSENTPCVCRELAIQQYNLHRLNANADHSPPALKVELTEQKPSIISIPPATEEDSINSMMSSRKSAPQSRNSPAVNLPTSSSILDNLPAYQPAVPLRRNTKTTGERANALFQIRLPSPSPQAPTLPAPTSGRPAARRAATSIATFPGTKRAPKAPSDALCSGDPSNCAACKDDDFGKAFCTALGDSMCSASPCATCPSPESCSSAHKENSTETGASSSTSGRPELHRSVTVPTPPTSTIAPKALMKSTASDAQASSSSQAPGAPSQPTASSSKMPANEAWQQLKSHPNIAFADLAMLADVVARRSKCSGPVVVVHPPLGSLTPERLDARSPAVPDADRVHATPTPRRDGESSPVLLTDPHAHFRAQEEHRALQGGPADGASVAFGASPDGAGLASAVVPSAGDGSVPPLRQISLVPQEELRQCGRGRMREVDAAGVKDALRILDAQFGRQ